MTLIEANVGHEMGLSRTRKIAFPFTGDSVGGSHISALELVEGLKSQGEDITVILHREGKLSEYCRLIGVEYTCIDLPFVQRIQGIKGLIDFVWVSFRLICFLNRKKFDLVHLNDGRIVHSWCVAAYLSGIRCLVHRRTWWAPSRLSTLIYSFASRFIVISEFIRSSVPTRFLSRTHSVVDPISIGRVNKRKCTSYVRQETGAAGKIVTFVGTLQAQKCPEILVLAASIVVRELPTVKFLFVGKDKDQLLDLRELVSELGLEAAVYFAGAVSNPEEWMAGSDLVVAPAVREGYGRVLVEAIMAGTPVIASDSGAHPEILLRHGGGELFAAGDVEALAAAIIRNLCHSDDSTELSAELSREVCEFHLLPTHVTEVQKIYTEMLK